MISRPSFVNGNEWHRIRIVSHSSIEAAKSPTSQLAQCMYVKIYGGRDREDDQVRSEISPARRGRDPRGSRAETRAKTRVNRRLQRHAPYLPQINDRRFHSYAFTGTDNLYGREAAAGFELILNLLRHTFNSPLWAP